MMGRRGGLGRGGGQVGDPLDGGRVVDDTGEGGKALDAREGGNLNKETKYTTKVSQVCMVFTRCGLLLALVVIWRRWWGMVWRMWSWGVSWFIWGVVGGGREMAAAGDRQLEAVDVQSLLIGVGKQPDKVVFLEATGVEVGVDEGAGGAGVHALLQTLGLKQ